MSLASLKKWAPLLGGIMGVQAVVQGLNAVSGILLVRLLPREDAYAWFTIASSTMILVNLLSDPGATAAVQSIAGPVWKKPEPFTRIIQSVRRHQRWLTGLAAAITLPWMAVLLHRVHAPAWVIAGAVAVLLIGAWPMAFAQILAHVNRLHSRYAGQLRAELLSAAARLLLIGVTVLPILFLWSSDVPAASGSAFLAAVFAAVGAALLYHQTLRRQTRGLLVADLPPSRETDPQIRSTLLHTAPFTLYYAVQGHLSTWLITWFGVAAGVADVGALGRLALIFGVAGAPIVQVAAPSFARCTDRRQLQFQILRVAGFYGFFAVGIVTTALLLPQPFLWILGPQYTHLGPVLPLALLGLVAANYAGMFWGLILARGWVKSSALVIPVGVAAQASGLFLFDISTVPGILAFNLFITVPSVLLALLIIGRAFAKWKAPTPAPPTSL